MLSSFIMSSFSSKFDDSDGGTGESDGDDGGEGEDEDEVTSPIHVKPSLPQIKPPLLTSCFTTGVLVITFHRDISPPTDSTFFLQVRISFAQ